MGRMDWSCTDFWLAVETGKNRSSTTTSPCTPYPLPSELQGDKVGKDYLLQNLYRYKRTSLSNGQPHSTLEKTHFIAEKIYRSYYVNPYGKKTQSAILHAKEEPEVTVPLNIISANCSNGCPIAENRNKLLLIVKNACRHLALVMLGMKVPEDSVKKVFPSSEILYSKEKSISCFPHFFLALTRIGATVTREAERFVDSGVLRHMTSFEVSISDFIEIHPILSFVVYQGLENNTLRMV